MLGELGHVRQLRTVGNMEVSQDIDIAGMGCNVSWQRLVIRQQSISSSVTGSIFPVFIKIQEWIRIKGALLGRCIYLSIAYDHTQVWHR